MSAELYDAEVTGALAQPAVDVLPSYGRRGRSVEPDAAPARGTAGADVQEAPAPLPEAAEPAPARSRFGLPLRRPRATAPAPEEARGEEPTAPVVEPAAVESAEPVPVLEPVPVPQVEPLAEVPVQQPISPSAPVAPVPDTSDEVRALRALLEASESQRMAAETQAAAATAYAQQAQTLVDQAQARAAARVEQAEARARSAANDAQDWQIRHREAEATVAELAGSLGQVEQRLTELRDRLDWVTSERDELLQALEEATSPDRSPSSS